MDLAARKGGSIFPSPPTTCLYYPLAAAFGERGGCKNDHSCTAATCTAAAGPALGIRHSCPVMPQVCCCCCPGQWLTAVALPSLLLSLSQRCFREGGCRKGEVPFSSFWCHSQPLFPEAGPRACALLSAPVPCYRCRGQSRARAAGPVGAVRGVLHKGLLSATAQELSGAEGPGSVHLVARCWRGAATERPASFLPAARSGRSPAPPRPGQGRAPRSLAASRRGCRRSLGSASLRC